MTIGFGLGFMYTMAAIGFTVIFAASTIGKSYLYQLLGKYGFIITLILASTQTSSDAAYATTPDTLGFLFYFLFSLLLLLIAIDTAYMIYILIPRKRSGSTWKQMLFGG